MKKLCTLVFAILLVSIVACQKQKIENAPMPPPVAKAYKIPLDSLKKQAVALGAIFGDPATKSRSVTAANAIAVSTVLGTKHMTKSYNTDPDLPQAYVINFNDDQGFAILVDDKRVGNNILAYSQSGNIDQSTDNPGVLIFMDQATEYIEAVSRGIGIPGGGIDEPGGGGGVGPIDPPGKLPDDPMPAPYEPDRSTTPSNWGSTIGPYTYNWYSYVEVSQTIVRPKLLTVNWGQGSPYNKALPRPDGGYYYTGCVATATVQLLSHYQWPTSVTVDGGTWNINWILAKNGDVLDGNIHYLMHDVGLKVYMSYGESSSSASSSYIPQEVLRQYGYSCTNLVNFNQNTIVSEIDSRRPIYIRGEGSSGGHAWIVDGYKILTDGYYRNVTDYYTFTPTQYVQVGQRVDNFPSSYKYSTLYPHCNWGWDGQNNGFFRSFSTTDADSFDNPYNSAIHNFNLNNKMIYNIKH